jgi:excisionase family DNA binding protein
LNEDRSTSNVAGDHGPLAPLLISVEQAMALLSVGRSTMYRLIADGEVSPIHIGRSVRFVVRELEAFVEARQAER